MKYVDGEQTVGEVDLSLLPRRNTYGIERRYRVWWERFPAVADRVKSTISKTLIYTLEDSKTVMSNKEDEIYNENADNQNPPGCSYGRILISSAFSL